MVEALLTLVLAPDNRYAILSLLDVLKQPDVWAVGLALIVPVVGILLGVPAPWA
jgi:hypothetical protein